jgi:transposase-like protein
MENNPAVARRNWPDQTKARIVEEARPGRERLGRGAAIRDVALAIVRLAGAKPLVRARAEPELNESVQVSKSFVF